MFYSAAFKKFPPDQKDLKKTLSELLYFVAINYGIRAIAGKGKPLDDFHRVSVLLLKALYNNEKDLDVEVLKAKAKKIFSEAVDEAVEDFTKKNEA